MIQKTVAQDGPLGRSLSSDAGAVQVSKGHRSCRLHRSFLRGCALDQNQFNPVPTSLTFPGKISSYGSIRDMRLTLLLPGSIWSVSRVGAWRAHLGPMLDVREPHLTGIAPALSPIENQPDPFGSRSRGPTSDYPRRLSKTWCTGATCGHPLMDSRPRSSCLDHHRSWGATPCSTTISRPPPSVKHKVFVLSSLLYGAGYKYGTLSRRGFPGEGNFCQFLVISANRGVLSPLGGS